MSPIRRTLLPGIVLAFAMPLFAGFGSTETFLPAVGRVAGQDGAQFYTTVWATNLTAAPQTMTFQFLKSGQANGTPSSFQDTLAPGETKVYENVVESKLGLANALGAARITSTGEIFVSERIYDQAPGDDLGNTEGLFFAGVPKSFSISAGQSASIQGIDQGGDENFRYNFALVETGGGSPTVNVQIFDGSGALLGQKAYILKPYEQIQPGVADVVAGIHTTNARITATVTGGTGSALLAGAQVANESQDSSGFEMTFRDSLLGTSGAAAGVTSLNGLTGAVTLFAGDNVTLTPDGNGIRIASSGVGAGVSSLDGLSGNLTIAAGSGVTITPSGTTLTISSSGGGGGGLALPFDGAASASGAVFSLVNSGSGGTVVATSTGASAAAVFGTAETTSATAIGVSGAAGGGTGVVGKGFFGVLGNDGTRSGYNVTSGTGVWGDSKGSLGVVGTSSTYVGIYGHSDTNIAIQGMSADNFGVAGQNGSASGYIPGFSAGVFGDSNSNIGVAGSSGNQVGVYGHSITSVAVQGIAAESVGVWGESQSTGDGVHGVSVSGYGVYGSTTSAAAFGVYAVGGIGATGTKMFVEPHPSDPTKEIRYVCLEGPESGTYFRGSAHIVNGFATIAVPEHFRMVSSEDGLTVVTTPQGGLAVLACVRKSLNEIVVQGSSDVAFDYVVNGVRRAFADFQPVSENRDFVPRSADDRLTVGLPAESIRRLKASGIVNADGSINLETAHRLGWDRQSTWNAPDAAAKAHE